MKRVVLCVGPVLFCLLDAGLTLQGQPDSYWSGDYQQAQELNPVGLWPLRQHPLAFLDVVLTWVLLFATSILLLPLTFARPLSFAVQFGHTIGTAAWAVRHGLLGWLVSIPVLLVSRMVFDWAWRVSAPDAGGVTK